MSKHLIECDALNFAGLLVRPKNAAHCRTCEVLRHTLVDSAAEARRLEREGCIRDLKMQRDFYMGRYGKEPSWQEMVFAIGDPTTVQQRLTDDAAYEQGKADAAARYSEVRIILDGGIVQDVFWPDGTPCPADVWDYDVEGLDEADLETDDSGRQYYVTSP